MGRDRAVASRFPRSKTHKASSAESILSHVLRERGWSKRWREGKLTGRQSLLLLEDIRQYGRRWLRHEAEAFFGRYGDDRSRGIRSILDGPREPIEVDGPIASSNQSTVRSLAGSLLSPLKRWFDRARQFVRELIFGGAMALQGTELTAQEAEQADQLASIQARYLDNFEAEIIANPPRQIAEPSGQLPGLKPPMSPAQIGARAELYATAAWQGAQRIQRASTRRAGNAKWERRILGHPKTEHCTDCPPLAALGWQPVGSLPDIGNSECGPLCLCHFEYSSDNDLPSVRKPGTPKQTRPKGGGRKPDTTTVINKEPEPPVAPSALPPATREEIDKEVKKWIAGEPSRLTVKKKYEKAPEPEFELPEGYEWSE